MKNSNLFIKLSCIIPVLLIICKTNLTAQNDIIGYTYMLTLDDHHYYISDCEATWEEANEAATEMGGYLVTINDGGNSENRFMSTYAFIYTDGVGAWIGFRGEQGIYEWANGEPINGYSWEYFHFSYFGQYQEPVYADGAALIGVNGYFEIYSNYEYDYSWISYPISGEFKYIVEFPYQPNCSNNPNKTYVCHNGNTICVNTSALQSHLDHGDLEGPCGPCNIPAMQALPDETLATEGHLHQFTHELNSESDIESDIVVKLNTRDVIQVFPNPASLDIKVQFPEVIKEGSLRIFAMTGQEIHTIMLDGQQSMIIDLSDYAQGFYLIDVGSANRHYQKKIVKL